MAFPNNKKIIPGGSTYPKTEAVDTASYFFPSTADDDHIKKEKIDETERTRDEEFNDRYVTLFVLIAIIVLIASFIFRFILRLIDEAKRWIKLLIYLMVVALIVSIYYAPVKTGLAVRRIIDLVIYGFALMGKFIVWLLDHAVS